MRGMIDDVIVILKFVKKTKKMIKQMKEVKRIYYFCQFLTKPNFDNSDYN